MDDSTIFMSVEFWCSDILNGNKANDEELDVTERKEETGMTDLQFKSFLKQLIGNLENARKDDCEKDKKLDQIIQDLKEDLQG